MATTLYEPFENLLIHAINILLLTTVRLSMSKKIFIKFVSEPRNDVMKTVVGIACAAQAVQDGHEVSIFFAGAGTRVLDPSFIEELDAKMGADSAIVTQFMETITSSAKLTCSVASVKIVLGYSQGDGALIVADDSIEWSGPPGVIALATASDVQLVY